jgi:hypothetical protein
MSGAALWPAALLPIPINLMRVCVCKNVGNPIMVAANPSGRKQKVEAAACQSCSINQTANHELSYRTVCMKDMHLHITS